jgi:hypothetical protein
MTNPIIDANGTKKWYLHGKLHRTDGPSIEWFDGDKEWWYLNGEEYTEDSFRLIQFNSLIKYA